MCNEGHEAVVREQIKEKRAGRGGNGAERGVLDKHICPWSFPLVGDAQHHILEVSAWTFLCLLSLSLATGHIRGSGWHKRPRNPPNTNPPRGATTPTLETKEMDFYLTAVSDKPKTLQGRWHCTIPPFFKLNLVVAAASSVIQ